MKYLQITNDGLIEKGALSLMGASSKRDDHTKIGQFGSGNKYTLAFLLRNNYSFRIYSGKDLVKVETQPEKFRDEMFNVIYIDGQKTSLTTKMGNEWKLWQAVRELYSNAIDEGNASIDFVDELNPVANKTHFYIEVTDTITELINDFDTYFANKNKVLFENEHGRILEKTGNTLNLYRKGIRCYDTNETSLFDYDLTEIDINESRTVKYSWTILEEVWELLFSCTDKQVILKVLQNCTNSMEGELTTMTCVYGKNMSKEFKEVTEQFNFVPSEFAGYLEKDELIDAILIPIKLYTEITSVTGKQLSDFNLNNGATTYRKASLNELQKATLKKAMLFFNECALDIPYEVIAGNFVSPTILGTTNKKEKLIIVSPVCIEKGINETVNTIIEEYIHLKYGASDCSRAFQTAAISELVTYMKIKNTYVL